MKRKNNVIKSSHNRVINDYFKITSEANINSVNLKKVTDGLRRTFGNWFDVKGKIILDLGCGTGELCWLVKNHGAKKIVGVNLSKDELDYASSKIDAEFICEDIFDYLQNSPDKSFDLVFALNIFEHLSKDNLVDVLNECHRVLKQNGYIIAIVPNGTSPYGSMTRYWDFTHLQSFTPSSIIQLMRLSGYRNVEFKELGPRIHGTISLIRFILWQFIRFFIIFRLMIETASKKGGIYSADMLFRLKK